MKLPFGFAFEETMQGTWRPLAGTDPAERSLSFTVRAEVADVAAWLRDSEVALEGTVAVAGLAEHAPARGTMLLSPLRRGIIGYRLSFTGDDGQPYELAGQKELRTLDWPRAMTTLPATLSRASGEPVGEATLHFDTRRDLLGFLASWKPIRAR